MMSWIAVFLCGFLIGCLLMKIFVVRKLAKKLIKRNIELVNCRMSKDYLYQMYEKLALYGKESEE